MSLARFSENLFRRPLRHPQPDSLPCGGGLGVQAAALKQTLPEKRKLSPLPNPLPREREQITAPSTFSDGIGKESYP